MAPSGRFYRRPMKRLPPKTSRQQLNQPIDPCCEHCRHVNEQGTEFEPWCTHCQHENGIHSTGPQLGQANQASSVAQQKAKFAGNYAWRENENEGVIPHSHGGRPCAYSSSSATESSFGLTPPSGSRVWKSIGFKMQQPSQSSLKLDNWKQASGSIDEDSQFKRELEKFMQAAAKPSSPGEDMDCRLDDDDDDDSLILSPYSGHESLTTAPMSPSMKANSQLDPTQVNLAESPSREILPSQTQKQKVGCCVRKASMKATNDSSAPWDSPPPQVINGKSSGSSAEKPKTSNLRAFSVCKEGPYGRPIYSSSPVLNYGSSKSCSPPKVNSHDPVKPTNVIRLVKQMRDQANELATMMLQLENLAIKVLAHSSGGEGRSEGILVYPGPVRSPKPKDGSSSSKGVSESSAGSASVFSASSTGNAFEPPPSSAATSGDVSILSATGSTQPSSQSQPNPAAAPADKPADGSNPGSK